MKKKKNNKTQLQADSQVNLYGYGEHFNIFNKLYLKKKLPNTILLSGQKGEGGGVIETYFRIETLYFDKLYTYLPSFQNVVIIILKIEY